jgi:hypothetical protein
MQLTIITSWDGVTISAYLQYKMVLEDPNISDFEKNLRILSILCGIDRETLNDLPANQIIPLFNKMEFLKIAPTANPEPYYEINGKRFALVMDVTKITAGQFIDLNHYTRDADSIIYDIHLICATLLLPVKEYRGKKIPPIEKYGESSTEERADFLYDHMPIKEALGISNFFMNLYSLFIEITKIYLEQTRMQQMNSASKILSAKNLNHLKTGSKKSGSGLLQ